MTQDKPRVSIGLAVYNGEDFLEQAIDSILAQTFEDFELIISDNASTDRTPAICRAYADRDPRVRYSRNEKNIGGANNENLTFNLARGEYFRWAADDDYVAPELLAKFVKVLDENPDVVLVSSMVNEVDRDGELINVISQQRGEATTPHERFGDLIKEDHHCEATYGLVRAEVLGKTRLQQNFTGSDRNLLCEISLYGRYHEIPEPLFFKRYHPRNNYVNMRTRMAWFNPNLKGKIVMPYWLQLFDYFVTVGRVPLPLFEKLRCYGHVVRWTVGHAKNLAGDLVLAGAALIRRSQNPYGWRNSKQDVYNWE